MARSGAALHARPDLLVPEAALEDCGSELARGGWVPIGGEADEADHHLAFAHAEATARIELHWTALASPHGILLPPTRLLARARPARFDGATIAVPAVDDQLVHLVAHGMLQHAFLENGRFLLRDLVEHALLLGRASETERQAARERLAVAGRSRAWEVSCELTARCLPQSSTAPNNTTLAARMLARRMLLQQRSPLLMDLLGPTGWLLARAATGPKSATPRASLSQLAEQLLIFRRKTRWDVCAKGSFGALAGLVVAAALTLAAPALALDKVTLRHQLEAEAEHGGFYQAVANGNYAQVRPRRDDPSRAARRSTTPAAGRRQGRLRHGRQPVQAVQLRQAEGADGDGGGDLPEGSAGAAWPTRAGHRQRSATQGQPILHRQGRPSPPSGCG